jgi:hypothetical protein
LVVLHVGAGDGYRWRSIQSGHHLRQLGLAGPLPVAGINHPRGARNARDVPERTADERFDNVLKRKSIVSIGENLSFLMNTKEKNNVVEVAFNGWKHSRSHYLQMVNPEKTHVAYYCCYDNVNRRYVCISVYAKKRA